MRPTDDHLHIIVCVPHIPTASAQWPGFGRSIDCENLGRLDTCAAQFRFARLSGEIQDPEIANPPGRAGCISAEAGISRVRHS